MHGQPGQTIQPSTIVFDLGKKPQFTPADGYQGWVRRLKTSGWKVASNKEDISTDNLPPCPGGILVIAATTLKYSEIEVSNVRKFVESGGGLLVLTTEGQSLPTTSMSSLLEDCGITISADSVVRTSYYKYFHPKEAIISESVLNRSLIPLLKRLKGSETSEGGQLNYVYPFGCTMSTTRGASVAILSSGPYCIPVQRPICVYARRGKGQIIVFGSSHAFHDNYIHKEDNFILMEMMIHLLVNGTFTMNPIDADNPDILDYTMIPDIETLGEEPISCLQEGESVPADFTKLFSKDIFELSNVTLVAIHEAIDLMGMEREPLKLIKPQFETPLPPLLPACFPPNFRLPEKPKLELFDLDDAFSSTATRLIQIANKCTESDLDYYVKECGVTLGVDGALKKTSKEILYNILTKVVEYKKVQDDD